MSARERLNHRLRWICGATVLGVVLVVAGIVAVVELGGERGAVIFGPGILVLMGVALAGQALALRCPWCRGNLGVLLMHTGRWRVSPAVRHCPYCGEHLDNDPRPPSGTTRPSDRGARTTVTGREHLNRRKRWLGLTVLAGIALVAVGGLHAAAGGGSLTAVPVVAGVLLLFAGATVGQLVALKCPWCRTNLGKVLMNAGFWRIDPSFRYCPYCGAELDAEVGTPGGADPWDEPVV